MRPQADNFSERECGCGPAVQYERPSENVFQTAFDVYLNEGTTSNVPPSSLLIKRHRVCASKSSGLGTSGKGFPFSKCTASPSWLNGCHTPPYGTRTVSPFSTSIGAVLMVLPSGSNIPSFIFGFILQPTDGKDKP